MDYEILQANCTKCDSEILHTRRCSNILCEGGYIDESEEDYLLPGTEMIECDICNGSGHETWCPKCGTDLSGEHLDEGEDYDI